MEMLNQLVNLLVAVFVMSLLALGIKILYKLITKNDFSEYQEAGSIFDNALDQALQKEGAATFDEIIASVYTELSAMIVLSTGLLKKYRDCYEDVTNCDALLKLIAVNDDGYYHIPIGDEVDYFIVAGKLPQSLRIEITDRSMIDDHEYIRSVAQTVGTRRGEYEKQGNTYQSIALEELKPIVDSAHSRLLSIEGANERHKLAGHINALHTELGSLEKSLKVTPMAKLTSYLDFGATKIKEMAR